MLKGETCELIARAEYAYGERGRPPDVPPGVSLRYEVELISWVPPRKERFELTDDERLAEARRLKGQGSSAYSSGLYLEAQVHYHEASRLLLNDFDELRPPAGKELECRDLLVACMLNVAQCALRREEWFSADKACTDVLQQLADPMGREKRRSTRRCTDAPRRASAAPSLTSRARTSARRTRSTRRAARCASSGRRSKRARAARPSARRARTPR